MKASKVEKFVLVIGFLGLAMLLPILLAALGVQIAALSYIVARKEIFTFIGFGLIGLTVLVGGGNNIKSTLIGILIGFLLISTALEIGFMKWFRDFTTHEPVFASEPLNYMVGLAVVFVGLLLSFSSKVKLWLDFVLLAFLPFMFIAACYSMDWLQFDGKLNISMDNGYSAIADKISDKYRQMPEVSAYLASLYQSDTLSETERKQKLQELQNKINTMENDQKILDELKKENISFKELLDYQAKKLEKQQWCVNAKDTSVRVKSYLDAVKTQQPCVRDFALNLVKHRGAYDDERTGVPTQEAIDQISDIHTYLSSNWVYVSDPVALLSDYISPADRTIALGLKGDCDDFAVINAACIEAIGGITRIVHGRCASSGHAWCEVYVGRKEDAERVRRGLNSYFLGVKKKEINFSIDDQGNFWLPLDWQIGNYTCHDEELEVAYSPEERFKKQFVEELLK